MCAKTKFPLYLPGRDCPTNKNTTVIAADLRRRKSKISVYNCSAGDIEQKVEAEYKTEDFATFSDMAQKFISDNQISGIDRISIAVPGPVISGRCETENLPWVIEAEKVRKNLGFKKAYLINDLEATAYSLADVYDNKFETIHTSKNRVRGNVAILAPGNGLGEAGLFYDGVNLRPFATEGGHSEFSPRTDFEIQFYQFLNKIYGIVTWESVLSKDGIYNIYRFLRDVGRHKEDKGVNEKVQNEDFLDVIAGFGQENSSRLVDLTVEMFLEFLAREANNLVLKLKATGGLIITGEITDKIHGLIDKEKFYKDFKISDRMEHLLKDIPIYILRNEKEIIEGAAYYGTFIESGNQ